ncbi:MAG: DUF4846 domain-containing protein, partial [Alphaproteobacteria bacterium]
MPIALLAAAVSMSGAIAAAKAEAGRGYSWPRDVTSIDTVASRFVPPAGFTRMEAAPGSFAAWLRDLPLKPEGAPVLHFDGRPKPNQSVHAAVVDI